MDYMEKATWLHAHGHNCCQSVVCCCCERFGLDADTAYRLGAFFGAGMRAGETCGAVTGALMALGLRYGDENNRQCGKSAQFLKAFKEQYGSIVCKELIAPEGMKKKQMCPAYINFAAKYLEDEFK